MLLCSPTDWTPPPFCIIYCLAICQEVGKRDSVMEERLRAQDVEYRRQCEELRVKVQQILKDRDTQMREKARIVWALRGVTWMDGWIGRGGLARSMC